MSSGDIPAPAQVDGVSIVIATKGRVALLRRLLESLVTARRNYGGKTEVILVDDSSPQDAEQIESMCREFGARRVYFSPSVAGKRNFGAQAAIYEIVLFLDSDCVATPHLIEHHLCRYTGPEIGGVAGPLEFQGEENWFWKAVTASPFVICFQMPNWGETSSWATTANFSVRKTAFLDVNGFDETFPNKPGGEDVDLGLRMTKRGYLIANTQEGLVYHDKETWMDPKQMFRRCWYYGRADVYLVERHPDFSCSATPRRMLLSLLAEAGMLAMAPKKPLSMLSAAALWPAADWLTRSLLSLRFGFQKTDLPHQAATQLLNDTNQLGYLWECAAGGKRAAFNRQTVFFDNQLKSILYNGSIDFWQFMLLFILMLTLGMRPNH